MATMEVQGRVLEVGAEMWTNGDPNKPCKSVTITKVGHKWIYFNNGLQASRDAFGKYVFFSEADYEAKVRADEDYRVMVNRLLPCRPAGVTSEDIERASDLLGINRARDWSLS